MSSFFFILVQSQLLERLTQKNGLSPGAVQSDNMMTAHLKNKTGQVSVAHACNYSYSGGRDQEDCSLKLAQANSL
jgi:hypothetical protein